METILGDDIATTTGIHSPFPDSLGFEKRWHSCFGTYGSGSACLASGVRGLEILFQDLGIRGLVEDPNT